MSARIMDGRLVADKIKADLRRQIAEIRQSHGEVPRLVNILLGQDGGACAYAKSQRKVAQEIGIEYLLEELPQPITQDDLIAYIRKLNTDPQVHGIMLHKPFPVHIDYRAVANQISMDKDLEGVNVGNIGRMLLGDTHMSPCTPAAVLEHLAFHHIPLRGKEVVIVGASEIVGKPLSLLFLTHMATVTVCHIATTEAGLLPAHVGRADILVVAVGKPHVVRGEWIKKDAVVIDVGINKRDDKIIGDVEFDQARERASWITPVPGGVGPVTVVMLMRNGILAYQQQKLKRA